MNRNKEYKKAEAILYNYNDITNSIYQFDFNINQIKRDIKGCGAIDYSKEKLSASYRIESSVESEVIAKEEKINELERKREKLIHYKTCVDLALSSLTSEHREIFEMWYKENKKYTRDYIIDKMIIYKNKFYKLRSEIVNNVIDSLNPNVALARIEEIEEEIEVTELGQNWDKNGTKKGQIK